MNDLQALASAAQDLQELNLRAAWNKMQEIGKRYKDAFNAGYEQGKIKPPVVKPPSEGPPKAQVAPPSKPKPTPTKRPRPPRAARSKFKSAAAKQVTKMKKAAVGATTVAKDKPKQAKKKKVKEPDYVVCEPTPNDPSKIRCQTKAGSWVYSD